MREKFTLIRTEHISNENESISSVGNSSNREIDCAVKGQIKFIAENPATTSQEDSNSLLNGCLTTEIIKNIPENQATTSRGSTILTNVCPPTCQISSLRETNLQKDCADLQTKCKSINNLTRTKGDSSVEENILTNVGAKTVKFQTQISIHSLQATNSNIYEGTRIIALSQTQIFEQGNSKDKKTRKDCLKKFFNSQTIFVLGYGLLIMTVCTLIYSLVSFFQKVELKLQGHHQV